MEHSSDLAFYMAGLIGVGALCQWVSWRMNLPAILPLLIVGLVLGPVTGVLDPTAELGDFFFPVVSLGVAIILFEGSLTLRFSDIRNVKRIIRNLTTIGVVITCGVMALGAVYFAKLSWPMALLFGALVSVTGPTVIVPMIRSMRPSERVANVLRWEGILIDPIGAVLAVLIFEFIHSGGAEAESLMIFAKVISVGLVWGIASGFVLAHLLKRHWLPDYLVNYFSLAFVLVVFTASNQLGDESGLVAVTVMGIVLANTRDLDVRELLTFKEDLTLLMISLLFILLAANLNWTQLEAVMGPGLILLGLALFVARPLSVLISSLGTSVDWKERALLSWVAPRGIVAAAVSSLFALRLTDSGFDDAWALVPLTFTIIIGTVVIQSLTAGWLASRLGLSSRGQEGILITTANKVALTIGEALQEQGLRVMVVDNDRKNYTAAKMRGLDAYYGKPLSEHTEHYLDLSGYTHLFAMSRHAETNAMVCSHFRHQFGQSACYMVQAGDSETDDGRQGLATGLRFNTLFPRGVTWSKLSSLLSQGAEIKATPLTEAHDYSSHQAQSDGLSIPLFALNEEGDLQVETRSRPLEPQPGWVLIHLVRESGKTRVKPQESTPA